MGERQCCFSYSKISKEIDLSGYESVNISFWRYVDPSIDSGEFLRFYIYKNRYRSQSLAYWTDGTGDDGNWHYETFEIPVDYLTSDFKIEFVAKADWYFEWTQLDDVLLEGQSS